MSINIIAEIGINHNGNIDTALDLMNVAADAGCDYAKFQKRTPSVCVPDQQKSVIKETPWGNMFYIDYKERMEFDAADYNKITRNNNIAAFASVWDTASVDFVEKHIDPDYYKIPSALMTDADLLLRTVDTGQPIILSTGMSTMREIENVMKYLLPCHGLILMHSVSCYPLADENANLKAIETLREFGYPVGYSDHTRGIHMACAAAAMGICMIEKHITLDRTMWGTDQSASLEPDGLKKMVRNIRAIEKGMGDGDKTEIQECEREALERLRP